MSDLIRLTCPYCKRRHHARIEKLRGKAQCACGRSFPIAQGLDTEPLPNEVESCSQRGDQSEQVAVDPSGTLLELLRRHRVHVSDHEIERKLGQGGFGMVFLSRHKVTGQRVALKVMRIEGVVTSTMIQRFQREITILKQLNHPNIVPLLDLKQA